MSEIWMPIPGYGGHYEASNLGGIRVKDRVVKKFNRLSKTIIDHTYRGRTLKATLTAGYWFVHLGVDGKKYSPPVHKLVLLAFVGPPGDEQVACHFDGNPQNNKPENLRWDTQFSNNQDRKRHGRYATGTDHPMSAYSPEEIAKVVSAKSLREATELTGMSRTHAHRLRARSERR